MNVLFVAYYFLVDMVCVHALCGVSLSQGLQVTFQKFSAISVHYALGVFREDLHLAQVAFGREVAFKPIGIATLLFAHLTDTSRELQDRADIAAVTSHLATLESLEKADRLSTTRTTGRSARPGRITSKT